MISDLFFTGSDEIVYRSIDNNTYYLNKYDQLKQIVTHVNRNGQKCRLNKMFDYGSTYVYHFTNDILVIKGRIVCCDKNILNEKKGIFNISTDNFIASLCTKSFIQIKNVRNLICSGNIIIYEKNSELYTKVLLPETDIVGITNFYLRNNLTAPFIHETNLSAKIICPKKLQWHFKEKYFYGFLDGIFHFVFVLNDILHYEKIELGDNVIRDEMTINNLPDVKIIFHANLITRIIYIITEESIWMYHIYQKAIAKVDIKSHNNIIYPIFSDPIDESDNVLEILSNGTFYCVNSNDGFLYKIFEIKSETYDKINDKIINICRDLSLILIIHRSFDIAPVYLEDKYLFIHENVMDLKYFRSKSQEYNICSFVWDNYLYIISYFDHIEIDKVDETIDISNYKNSMIRMMLSDTYLSHKITSASSITIAFQNEIIKLSLKNLTVKTLVDLSLDPEKLTYEFNKNTSQRMSFHGVINYHNELNINSFDNLFDNFLSYMHIIDNNTGGQLNLLNNNNIIASGNGVDRHFVEKICTEIQDRFFIQKDPITLFNRNAISKLAENKKNLLSFGKLLHWLISLNGTYLPIRLPVEFLNEISRMSFSEICMYANMVDNSTYKQVLPYFYKTEEFKKLECGHDNPIDVLSEILIGSDDKNHRDNISNIVDGFLAFGKTRETLLGIDITLIDTYVSGPYEIMNEAIIQRLHFSPELNSIKKIFTDVILNLSKNEIKIFLLNIGGTTSVLKKYSIVLNINDTEVTPDIKYITCSSSALIKKSILVGNQLEIENKLKFLLMQESMMLD